MMDNNSDAEFLSWFASQNGVLDPSVGLSFFKDDGGRGAIALTDIPEGHVLFSLPRTLTLSTRTSSLPSLFGIDQWKTAGLDKGWVGLILCMMWEEAQGNQSRWSGYLKHLPNIFTTPMFWSQEDLAELKGTCVVDKIGRDDAEKDYVSRLLPAIQSRPELFRQEDLNVHYSLERYHVMGSRILSRSFHVEVWQGDKDDAASAAPENTSTESVNAMNIDEPVHEEAAGEENGDEGESSDDEDDIEDPADVAMVPMADMLNARHSSGNAKLFYEDQHVLQMISTKPIAKGEQIWNTYGDPPNSDLLRRYGHVDVIVNDGQNSFNPADIVEVAANVIVAESGLQRASIDPRIEWWLDQGGDDVFVLDTDLVIPDDMLSFTRLVVMTSDDWEKVKLKSKPPKPKRDIAIVELLVKVLRKALGAYPTTREDDEHLLSQNLSVSVNQRNALIVRLGEKRLLTGALRRLEEEIANSSSDKKRKERVTEANASRKRSKR